MTQKNELAKKQQNIAALMMRPEIQSKIGGVAASGLTPERVARIALMSINKTPKLAECTVPSLMQCVMDCASLGLEPDGRNAHLIPYKDKCTLIIDWKGICRLARESGKIETLYADIICENDDYSIERGANPNLVHKIKLGGRGNPIAAYAFVRYKNGGLDFEVMTWEEVQGIRKRSPYGDSGPWVTDEYEMAKKTAFRRLSKRLPLGRQSATVERVLDVETGHADPVEEMIDVTPNKEPEAVQDVQVGEEVGG